MNSFQIKTVTWFWNRIRISYGMGTLAIGYARSGEMKDTILISVVNIPVFEKHYLRAQELKEVMDEIVNAAE